MFWTTVKRISRSGFLNFKRNGVVSLASVLIVSVTLLVGLSIIFLQVVLANTLDDVRNKVDVNIYFTLDAPSDKILGLKESLEQLPEVESVVFVSAEEALAAFRERHKDDYLTIQALEELGTNPLGASLNIKAKDPSQYEGIADFIEGEDALGGTDARIIDRVNYEQNKVVIDRLTAITDSAERLGFLVMLVFAAVSVIITFNTIRLTIYIAREEIGVMRLVGASHAQVRGPFVVEGIIYGAIAALISIVIFFPVTYWLGGSMSSFLGINLYQYYVSNLFQFFAIMLGAGILIGALSSVLAIRKYLND